MNQLKITYTLQCHNCPYGYKDSEQAGSEEVAMQKFIENGWRKVNGIYKCPLCMRSQ